MLRAFGITLTALLALPAAGLAQTAPAADTVRLSLTDAVGRALATSEEAQLAAAQVELAQAQLVTARASALPQLRFTGTYSHVIENARAQAVGQIFNQPNTYNASANLSQPLFQGGRVVAGLRAASRTRAAAGLTQEDARAQVALDVQRAYLQASLANRLLEIQEANLALATEQLTQVERFEKSGRAARYDVLRARVERANLEPAVIQARSDRELALLEVKRLVNLPMEQPLALTTTVDAAALPQLVAQVEQTVPGEPRASLRAAELTSQARREAVRIARADWLPTLSVVFNSGFQAYPTGTFPALRGRILSTECPPSTPAGRSCTQHNGGFFPDRSVGLQMSWALFDGLRTKGNIDQAQAQANVARLQLAQEREAVALEVASARASLAAAKSLFSARQQNVTEAAEAYRLASLRFGRGLSTQLEVTDAQVALLTAQINEARAVHELYLATASLAHALGEPVPTPPSRETTPTTPSPQN